MSSHPPNQPGVLHDVVEEVLVGRDEVVVMVGAGLASGLVTVLVNVVVLSSLHPNQPGSKQVEDVTVVVNVVVGVVVVDSSRQPHQPGVLHVSVRVRDEVEIVVLVLLVVVSVPLLS